MFAALRRHPFAVTAFFRRSLVLTFAYPQEMLQPLLPPGLVVDSHAGCGFVAIALVQTERLRPAGFPAWLGRDFFLAGYRIFSRFRRRDGSVLRGLRILRSDADRRSMVVAGNLFTRYRYHACRVRCTHDETTLAYEVTSSDGATDLSVRVRTDRAVEAPPPGSPFEDLKTARRFAGPLPHTFADDPAKAGIVVVKGVREDWTPVPVEVESVRSTFLQRPPFDAMPPRLANAFLVENIPYRWQRGVLEPLPDEAR